MGPEDVARRLASKRFNERVKLVATFANNSGIALLVGGLLIPYLGGRPLLETMHPLWVFAPIGLHMAGQVVLTSLRSED